MVRPCLAVVFAVAVAGCLATESIDPAELPVSIEGYEQWPSFTVTGPAPGHGDTVREIYVNDVARGYTGGGRYPAGAAVVKEIYARGPGGERGELRYVAIMRRIDADAAPDLPIQRGWLFTDWDGASADELQIDRCWDTCHRAAPYAGAWFDYGRAAGR